MQNVLTVIKFSEYKSYFIIIIIIIIINMHL